MRLMQWQQEAISLFCTATFHQEKATRFSQGKFHNFTRGHNLQQKRVDDLIPSFYWYTCQIV